MIDRWDVTGNAVSHVVWREKETCPYYKCDLYYIFTQSRLIIYTNIGPPCLFKFANLSASKQTGKFTRNIFHWLTPLSQSGWQLSLFQYSHTLPDLWAIITIGSHIYSFQVFRVFVFFFFSTRVIHRGTQCKFYLRTNSRQTFRVRVAEL